MSARPVQISMDEAFLARIDSDPEVAALGRSAFIRKAVSLYLDARARRRVDDQIDKAYDTEADAMLDEIGDMLGGQSWPDA